MAIYPLIAHLRKRRDTKYCTADLEYPAETKVIMLHCDTAIVFLQINLQIIIVYNRTTTSIASKKGCTYKDEPEVLCTH